MLHLVFSNLYVLNVLSKELNEISNNHNSFKCHLKRSIVCMSQVMHMCTPKHSSGSCQVKVGIVRQTQVNFLLNFRNY